MTVLWILAFYSGNQFKLSFISFVRFVGVKLFSCHCNYLKYYLATVLFIVF